MTVIEGTDANMGRLASNIAKRLLNGEQIDLINSEKVIISGRKEQIIEKYQKRQSLQHHANPKTGPKFYKMPNMIVKRSVRGMLPMKTTRGRLALKKFKAYIGVPKELEAAKKKLVKEAFKEISGKHITVKDVSTILGAKW